MNLLVRDANPDDAEALIGILNPIIQAGIYTVFDTPFSAEEEREFVTTFPKHGVFHVAESSESQQVVGFQNLAPFADYTHAFDHVYSSIRREEDS